MRSTLTTLTKHTIGRVRRRTSTKQRSMILVVRSFVHNGRCRPRLEPRNVPRGHTLSQISSKSSLPFPFAVIDRRSGVPGGAWNILALQSRRGASKSVVSSSRRYPEFAVSHARRTSFTISIYSARRSSCCACPRVSFATTRAIQMPVE